MPSASCRAMPERPVRSICLVKSPASAASSSAAQIFLDALHGQRWPACGSVMSKITPSRKIGLPSAFLITQPFSNTQRSEPSLWRTRYSTVNGSLRLAAAATASSTIFGVVGVDQRAIGHATAGHESLRRIADDAADALAHEEHRPVGIPVAAIDGARQIADQRLVFLPVVGLFAEHALIGALGHAQ